MRIFSNRSRPVHLGPHPLEQLPRLDATSRPPGTQPGQPLPPRPAEPARAGPASVGGAMLRYVRLLDDVRGGPPAPAPAPVPDDPAAMAAHLKASVYFLDADLAGVAPLPADATPCGEGHCYALVVVVGFATQVRPGEPGERWVAGCQQANADRRAAEVAVIAAGYIRRLGFGAEAHTATATDIDLDRLALQAGVAEVRGRRLRAPYLTGGFGVAAVTTDLTLALDGPLARRGLADRWRAHGPGWWLGVRGTRLATGPLRRRRPLHLGSYPMEKIRRVDETTTLVTDEVPRVPARANFFMRARYGDLGPKFANEVKVFASKTPSAQAYISLIQEMVPLQDGEVAPERAPGTDDPDANAAAVKALGYFLGADMVGICPMPDFAWYSHRVDGSPIEPYHRNAVVLLLDQGRETMEGASGDDWISGSQSMRAYMRSAEIAGILASHLRGQGWPARSQTNASSDVVHVPLVLLAGLGELSRIGEVVLNPFVGPRFKSVVLTTDLPLTADRPIDFGLQDFCSKCTKCARECPCGAISFGDKVMFNGYEMWKPDVEKCTKYRVGNQKGSACGRCMKTCPFNTEGIATDRFWLWVAIRFPFMRRRIAQWDDRFRRGTINPVKKWWFDLEWVGDRAVEPTKGTNARTLDMDGGRIARTQRIAVYPAEVNPPPDSTDAVKVDRPAAVAAGERAETPFEVRRRLATPR